MFMVKKLVSFHGSRKFLTTCTRVPRRALSRASWIQLTSSDPIL